MDEKLNILIIEPYFDGSHKEFLEGFCENSRHSSHLLTMPARKWKWRMRASAFEMAGRIDELKSKGQKFDAIFCSDMLNLSELKGICKAANLPSVIYFHENQFTYPNQVEDKRDFQFGITNLSSALAADKVMFNSGYHLEDFLSESEKVLRKMPDFKCLEILEQIREKSQITYPGISGEIESRIPLRNVPRISWAARWEHDKNPEDFFLAARILQEKGIEFRLNVLGQSFANSPSIFEQAKTEFADIIENWGFKQSKREYLGVLKDSDIFVSTANHEFFGISALEASSAGCACAVPNRLAYPETFQKSELLLYGSTAEDLAERLETLITDKAFRERNAREAIENAGRFKLAKTARLIDSELLKAVQP
ncbi:GDP-mannose-dependent alpha-(1-6)-phosphatidylinositol dimannoside mannosyltransferase [Sedimentisphaera cyanobacteriorum]|uniref:tRNA-queuosine alpha-mannosyltransferase n=1 Tax=Sedimentisphaera cyanobacteriorum TaxID=1940790 RepID=A0A1Q2HSM0_9BACT|nr:DUF3524 domain-containing protein [Sedimentisphaera cyanobacteriorum]AQQ10235.1 GDP-mannose-dependent alpha-(1-6)-phosphatidylinositol dimannoside mannosyltransferase [Sedimentisphaera cyanobacteriorum]